MAEGKQKGDFTDWPRAGEKQGDHGVYPGTLSQGIRWLAGLAPKVAWEDSGGAAHPARRASGKRQDLMVQELKRPSGLGDGVAP